jgi:H+/Cl- antiporter ClcA
MMTSHVESIIFVIVILCIIGYICRLYETIHSQLSLNALKSAKTNPKIFYILSPILFCLAANAFFFKNANGPLVSRIKSLFYNLNQPTFFKELIPLTSLFALVISSLIAVGAGGILGSEAVLISISTILLLFTSDYFKNNVEQLNIEKILYIGYIFGFTFAFRDPISSFILVIEKSLMGHSKNVFTNALYSCIGIATAYFFMNNEQFFPNAVPQKYTYELASILQCVVLALFCGVFACLFFKLMYKLYFTIENIYSKNYIIFNIVPIVFGLCIAAIINNIDGVSVGGSSKSINEIFKCENIYTVKNIIGNIVNILLTFTSGCSGGLIIPSISIGSYIGFFYNKITTLPLIQTLTIGMTSVFSAFFGYPISSAFVIQNISNQNLDTLPLLILTSYISYFSYKTVNKLF